jgi:hypothetical protein
MKMAGFVTLGVAAVAVAAGSASATVVDLTSSPSFGIVNGARFETFDFRSGGTGVIQPFLRVQANGTEQGYNTSGSPVPFDDKVGSWTHDLHYGDVPTVNIGGTDFKEFILDINQTLSNPLLTLDEVHIFKSSVGSQTTTNVSSLGTSVYDLDAGGDSSVELNAALSSGSGQGDMRMYVPLSAFGSITDSTFLYLYCQFGVPQPSNDGFEEWAIRTPTPIVPLPHAAWAGLSGLAAAGAAGLIRRRRMA